MDNATRTSAPNDESMPPSAFAVATDPRKAAGQVREILKARDAERDNIFSGVMALVGYLDAAGAVVCFIALALSFFKMIGSPELGIQYYILAVGYFIVESGVVLMSTLPPETFDFDLALDDRRGARRAFTIGVLLLSAMQGLNFPHISGLGALGLLVKLVWDESVAGCCRSGARETQHATGFRDDQGRRVHNPIDAGCGARFRPRLTDMVSLCLFGLYGLHYGGMYVFSTALCHAMAANTSTSNNANWTTTMDTSLLHNSTMLGNITNSTSITCSGNSFK